MCLLEPFLKNHGGNVSKKLTKRIVDSTGPSEKDVYVWDSDIKGFGLKVTPSGRKVYIYQYRIGGKRGRTRRMTLGVHGGAFTPVQARQAATVVHGQVMSGIDPAAERDKAKDGKTMAELLAKFDRDHIAVNLKSKTASDYRSTIRLHILPKLQHMLVQQVSRQDIARLHHSMRDTPYMANRVVATLSKFFNWCEKFGYRAEYSNPCRHVDKFKEKRRHRYLTTEEQVRLGETLTQIEKERLISLYAVAAIRLLNLTGARLSEILTLKWEYVNWENGTLDLPDSKTGAKTIYLNDSAKDILSNIARQVDNPYVICGAVPGERIVNLQKSWRLVRARAGLDDVRLHDLRHTFASIAVSGGMSLPMIGALLGHSQPRTTARYAHLAANPLKEAVQRIGQHFNEQSRSAK